MATCDVQNRHAFENNDPINKVDPTGHMSAQGIVGTFFGVVLVVTGLALTIATAGLAAPLAAGLGV